MTFIFTLSMLFSASVANATTDFTTHWGAPSADQQLDSEIVSEPAGPSSIMDTGAHYDWGRGIDGWAHCYEYTSNGSPLNGGAAQADHYCEASHPSHYGWGRSISGYGGCYHYTPRGLTLDNGAAFDYSLCEPGDPSHYSWSRSISGYTYCYHYTPQNLLLHDGRPMDNSYCR